MRQPRVGSLRVQPYGAAAPERSAVPAPGLAPKVMALLLLGVLLLAGVSGHAGVVLAAAASGAETVSISAGSETRQQQTTPAEAAAEHALNGLRSCLPEPAPV